MKRILLLLIAVWPFFTNAQHFELGAMVGISNYQGDLAPESLGPKFKQTHAAFGGFLRYNVNNYLAARFNVFYGTISGDDANANTQERRDRNLSFKSGLLEFGLTAEYNILGYQPYNLERIFSPYLFAGVALYRYNPKAFYDGRWVELQPLGTEGQGLASEPDRDFYKLTQFSIPFGVGVKYAINDAWNLGLELGMRATFNDYLDDVSLTYTNAAELLAERGEVAAALSNRSGDVRVAGDGRGDASRNDWYFMGGITISYNFLDNGLVGIRLRNRRKTGCQTF
ncbi:MAG: DUF6089 family protein [Bacteroidota bacterium]